MSKQNAASPPFATADGKPVSPATSGGGGHDFVKQPTSPASSTGFDVTKQNRPQSEADPRNASSPNKETIPAGGPLPYPAMDPSAQQKSAFGARGPQMPPPFKNLK